jgi:hypothetical protein
MKLTLCLFFMPFFMPWCVVSQTLLRYNANSVIVSANCTEAYDCSYNGICTNEKTCKCNDGYVTYPSNHVTGCNYKQKSTLVAFLLQFFLGFISGAGYFYLGQTELGLGQLFLFWGGTILSLFFACCSCSEKSDSNEEILYKCVLYMGCIIWYMYSLAEIGGGITKDGNGAPIASL